MLFGGRVWFYKREIKAAVCVHLCHDIKGPVRRRHKADQIVVQCTQHAGRVEWQLRRENDRKYQKVCFSFFCHRKRNYFTDFLAEICTELSLKSFSRN